MQGKLPVDELVDQCIDVVGTPVLVIQIVGVLPHINGQQRLQAGRLGQISIGRLDHLELVAVGNKPGPAATENFHGRIAKGIRVGTKVRQGQVIAYVGMTGRSTGPQCQFRGTLITHLSMTDSVPGDQIR